MRLYEFIILTIILSTAVIAGEIAITSVDSTEVQPGQTTNIIMTLENRGDSDIEDISVSLDLSSSDLPFAPVGSAAQKIIEKIKEDNKKTVQFQLIALPEAKPTIYKIPVKLNYGETEDQTIITVKINAQPDIEVALEESEIVKVGDQGEVIIRFVNKGLTDIKFLTAEVIPSQDYSILSVSSFYVGNIEPDDFETVTFKLRLNKKTSFLPIKIQYRDSENKIFTETKFLDMIVYSEDEAMALGLIKTNYTPFIITTIILIIIVLIIIRSVRKKKRAKQFKL